MSTGRPNVAIIGGGIAGLALALSLRKHLGVNPVVYEQAPRFDDEVGGAIGIYPNGLRVFRDIDPLILHKLRAAGTTFGVRRWMRHDGSEVAVGDERYLCDWESDQDQAERLSIGIRRWRLQRILFEACVEANVPIYFNERLQKLLNPNSNAVQLTFDSGRTAVANFVFGCDGVKSIVRNQLFGKESPEPAYTGVTIFMGAAKIPRLVSGICFPSSSTTKCHAVFYPTGASEQVFQIYFVTPERPETWKPLSFDEGRTECNALANTLQQDGWAEQFLEPLRNAVNVIRVGLRARDPIPKWYRGNVVLLGDAAHPPVPYIGQGAMMALEDVGVLVRILKHLSITTGDMLGEWPAAMQLYEQVRIPRTTTIYRSSHALGKMQLHRAGSRSWFETVQEEWGIWWNVKRHGTLPQLRMASSFNAVEEAEKAVQKYLTEKHVQARAKL